MAFMLPTYMIEDMPLEIGVRCVRTFAVSAFIGPLVRVGSTSANINLAQQIKLLVTSDEPASSPSG